MLKRVTVRVRSAAPFSFAFPFILRQTPHYSCSVHLERFSHSSSSSLSKRKIERKWLRWMGIVRPNTLFGLCIASRYSLDYKHVQGDNMKKIFTFLVLAMSSAQASGFSDCYTVAAKTFSIPQNAIRACGKAGEGFSDCMAVSKSVFRDKMDAIENCASAGKNFKECYAVAKNEFSDVRAILEACGVSK